MKHKYYLGRLKRHTPYENSRKILNKIYTLIQATIEASKANLASKTISDNELKNALLPPFQDINLLIRDLKQRKRPPFFIDFIQSPDLLNLIKQYYPESISQTLADADRICEHIFDILGSGQVSLGEKINWHRDFKADWIWKPKYYKLIGSLNLDKSYDMKVPWELSRCQHFITLGKAYIYTKNEKYAAEFVNQITDWIESNPPNFGVNWSITMEVAIRIANWIGGYYFFIGSPTLTDDFLLKFIKSLLAHGRYIINNLENKISIPNNHYLANLVGLIYLGFIFPEFKEAEEWRNFGVKELIKEAERQFYPDGMNFEGSISYHRLSTELVLFATILTLLNTQSHTPLTDDKNNWSDLLKNSNIFSESYINHLERMLECVLYYTKPDGTSPQIGDSDDGRLHILSNYANWSKLDHRYLLSIGAVLFDRPDFKNGISEFHEEAFWLLGKNGLNRFNFLSTKTPEPTSKTFPESGFYIMRDEDLYMIIDCFSTDPKSSPGHRHNSKLSFELFAYDKSFIVDPGTYAYTYDLKWRNIFRSTEYHNTIKIDEKEQNKIEPTAVFWIDNQANVKVNKWEMTNEYDFLDAEHNGYKRLADSLIHRRQIFFSKTGKYWLIRDMIISENQKDSDKIHKLDFNLHFAPMEVSVCQEFPLSIIAQETQGIKLLIVPVKIDGLSALDIKQGSISYSYGLKIEAPVVKYSKCEALPVEFMFLFYPYKELDINIAEIQNMIPSFMKTGI